ncbi:putative threonine efflux protein [Burkholderiales bacterium JOSHI_001]|nr:putative threonine efflux protein [Burkholderiales bacterium JOSHI_001]
MVEGVQNLPLFIGAGLLLNITPGADMALVVTRSAAHGFRAGAAAALGVGAGGLLHAAAVALGLATLLAQAPQAMAVLRWGGAAYLVWLGMGLLRAGAATPASDDLPSGGTDGAALPFWRIFGQGFLTNALNPKVALFFLALLPQFVAPDAAHPGLALWLLGLLFNLNGTLVNLAIAAGVARLRETLRSRAAVGRWLRRVAGGVFVALGLKLALGR